MAAWCYDHRRRVLVFWIGVLVVVSAVSVVIDTSERAVVFAGGTVVISLLGLLILVSEMGGVLHLLTQSPRRR